MVKTRKNGKKRKNGRPTKYQPEYAQQVYKLCLLGATDKQIADFFDVSVRTIQYWKHAHKDFLHSLKRGKMEADAQVAEALFNRAKGFEREEVKFFCHNGSVIAQKFMRYYPTEVTACIFWLKNRQPQLWREQQHLTIHEPPAPLSDDEVMERIADLEAAGNGLATG